MIIARHLFSLRDVRGHFAVGNSILSLIQGHMQDKGLIHSHMQDKDNRIDVSRDSDTLDGHSFMDADGTHWRVYEQAFADYDRRTGMSLIFASESAVRRVRDYPADWKDLGDEALLALSWHA